MPSRLAELSVDCERVFMKVDLKSVRRTVRDEQEACLRSGVPFVVLDNAEGAYVEYQPDGSKKLLEWCADHHRGPVAKTRRFFRRLAGARVEVGTLEQLHSSKKK